MKNLEIFDVKHQNPKLIQNVTYLRNYETTDLQKKKQTLFVAVKRNLWNCSAIVLRSMIEHDEATTVVLWCDGL